MDAEAVAQLVTLALAVLTLVWHQQRSTDKVRDEVQAADQRQQAALDKLRVETQAADQRQQAALDKLRDAVAHNGQRLARIEGVMGIGVPPAPAGPQAAPGGTVAAHSAPSTAEPRDTTSTPASE